MACACKKKGVSQPSSRNLIVKRGVSTANGRKLGSITRRIVRRNIK